MSDSLPDDVRLPRQPGVIRRFWAEHPRVTDWLVALFWGLPALLVTGADLHDGNGTGGTLLGVVLIAAACVGFFLRRTRPILALGILALALLPTPFTNAGAAQVLPVFGVYSLAVYRSSAAGWIGAVALEAASTLYLLAATPFAPADAVGHTPLQWPFVYGFELVVALLIGVTVGNRRRYLAALIDRAHQLARERDQRALLATVAERARIAREMHDVVSHSLTVMVTLADGSAALAETDAGRAAAAMRQVADTGRDALTDMRRMLGVLGGDDPELAPQPTAAQLPALVEQYRALDLPVTLRLDGRVPDDATVQLTVYRVVQESLTNALRYAQGPTRVDVRVDAEGDPLLVSVEDDGLPGPAVPSVGAGRGLLGLTERVIALGGTLTAGPRSTGAGWAVSAVLPASGTPGEEVEEHA